MINRRGFVRLLAGGIAGAVAVANLPTQVFEYVPGWLQHESVLVYLTRLWNSTVKGTARSLHPTDIFVGERFFRAFEGELTIFQRFTADPVDPWYDGYPRLCFKLCRLQLDPTMNSWDVRFENRRGLN